MSTSSQGSGANRPPDPGGGWLKNAWNWLVNPEGRLSPDFPLTGKKLGKTYVIASLIFFAGSFLPGLLLVGSVFLLLQVAPDAVAYKYLSLIFDFKDGGTFKTTPMTILLLVSFISGFVPELWYLGRVLKRSGTSLWQVMGLTLGSLRRRVWWLTAWAVIWRVALAYALMFALDHVLSKCFHGTEQPTVELMRKASGGNILIWFFMAAILAPLFEELVFRGFLFQALRATFREWQSGFAAPVTLEPIAASTKPRGIVMRAVVLFFRPLVLLLRVVSWPFRKLGNLLSQQGSVAARWLGKHVVNTPGRADLAAVLLSGALFAVEHMQFQPLTLLMLFLMGSVLAEIFRRTGSLWPGIILHAINNGVVVVLIAMGAA